MSKQMEYRQQIEVIESQLIKENKEYMGRINGYMMIASVFHRQEEAVTAQLLSIYQDVLEAQKDGLSAEEFLGKDSKQMADDLLNYLPPIGVKEVGRLAGLVWLVYVGSQFLMEFAGSGTVQFNWLALVCDSLLAFLLPAGIILLLRNLIYQTSKLKIWATYIGFPLVYVAILAGRFTLLPDWYRHLFDWLDKPDSSPPHRSRSAIFPKGKISPLCLFTDLSLYGGWRCGKYGYDCPSLAQSGVAHSASHGLLDWNCGFVGEKGEVR